MNPPQNTVQIVEALQTIRENVHQLALHMPEAIFFNGTAENWSAADYLKHLILSIKPLAKALKFPAERLSAMFGTAERASLTYDEVVARYKVRLSEGIRAEDYEGVTPAFYRFPEGVTDIKAYLIETWQEANQRLLTVVDGWSEADLDQCLIPHPAIGSITVREMLFFTVYHNDLHAGDIQRAADAQTGVPTNVT
jgi:hypothetical protein